MRKIPADVRRRGGPRAGAPRRRRLGPGRAGRAPRGALRRRAASTPRPRSCAPGARRSRGSRRCRRRAPATLVPDFARRLAERARPAVRGAARARRATARRSARWPTPPSRPPTSAARSPSPPTRRRRLPARRRPALQRLDAGDGRRPAAPARGRAGLPAGARDGVLSALRAAGRNGASRPADDRAVGEDARRHAQLARALARRELEARAHGAAAGIGVRVQRLPARLARWVLADRMLQAEQRRVGTPLLDGSACSSCSIQGTTSAKS